MAVLNPVFLSCVLQTNHYASPLLNLVLATDIRISSCLLLMGTLKPKTKKKPQNLKALQVLAHFVMIYFPTCEYTLEYGTQ